MLVKTLFVAVSVAGTHTDRHTQQQQTRLTFSQLYCTSDSLQHTRVIYGSDTGHTLTRRPEVAVNSHSAFNPSRIVLLPGPCRSSGQLLSARGPSDPSILVRDVRECSVLFACFYCWGSWWRKPLVNTGRTCKLHTERPGR